VVLEAIRQIQNDMQGLNHQETGQCHVEKDGQRMICQEAGDHDKRRERTEDNPL
jgi:hypothetical protein